MRVLHVTPHFAPAYQYGGAVAAIAALCRALASAGHSVSVLTTDFDGSAVRLPHRAPRDLEGVDVRYLRGVGPDRLGIAPAFRTAVDRAIQGADLVHVHGVYHFTTAIAARTCRRRRIPYVITPHGVLDPACIALGTPAKRWYLDAIGWRDVRRAAVVHFTSEPERQKTESWGVSFRSAVVPNCLTIDPAGRPPLGTFRPRIPNLAARRLIVFLGLLTPKKGIDVLLDAAARLASRGRDVHVALAGAPDRPSSLHEIRRAAADPLIADRVTFTGFLSGPDKLALLRDADVFVLPSLSENFGNAVIEAMACEVPVVVTPAVDLADAVREADGGLVVERTAGDIAGAIDRILSDEPSRLMMGRRGRAFTERVFHPPEIARQMANVYAETIARYRAPAAAAGIEVPAC